jgi:hypothetical protein
VVSAVHLFNHSLGFLDWSLWIYRVLYLVSGHVVFYNVLWKYTVFINYLHIILTDNCSKLLLSGILKTREHKVSYNGSVTMRNVYLIGMSCVWKQK